MEEPRKDEEDEEDEEDNEYDGERVPIVPAISKDNCCGFPETLNPLADNNGHGTSCAALLLRTAPDVELFIGRVVDDNGKLDNRDSYSSTVEVRQKYDNSK